MQKSEARKGRIKLGVDANGSGAYGPTGFLGDHWNIADVCEGDSDECEEEYGLENLDVEDELIGKMVNWWPDGRA